MSWSPDNSDDEPPYKPPDEPRSVFLWLIFWIVAALIFWTVAGNVLARLGLA